MAQRGPQQPPSETVSQIRESVSDRVTDVLVTGFVILVPFILTLYIIDVALGILAGILRPVIAILQWAGIIQQLHFGLIGQWLVTLGIYKDTISFLSEFIAIMLLVGLVVVLGGFANLRIGERLMSYLDALIFAIPGVGAIYRSFRRMGDVVLESGIENFQSVKLVEFPREGMHSFAFETNRSPESVQSATGEENSLTLFIPLAPNPVMGGFLVHMPEDEVIHTDITVEEAARTLITSGVAAGDVEGQDGRSLEPFRRLRNVEYLEEIVDQAKVEELTKRERGGNED